MVGNVFCSFLLRRKIYDEYNDEEVELTKEETKLVRRLLKGKAPHADFDPYAVRIHYAILNFSPFCYLFTFKF